MQIGPQHGTIHALDCIEHMMMITPVDTQKYETEKVAQKDGNQWPQGGQVNLMWHPQLEHHDGDDYCNHSITKGFHAVLGHGCSPSSHALRMPGLSLSVAKYSWISFAYSSRRSKALSSWPKGIWPPVTKDLIRILSIGQLRDPRRSG